MKVIVTERIKTAWRLFQMPCSRNRARCLPLRFGCTCTLEAHPMTKCFRSWADCTGGGTSERAPSRFLFSRWPWGIPQNSSIHQQSTAKTNYTSEQLSQRLDPKCEPETCWWQLKKGLRLAQKPKEPCVSCHELVLFISFSHWPRHQ